jgi:hypothetical protein
LKPGAVTVMLQRPSAVRSAVCGDSVLVDSSGWPAASTANSTTLPKGKPALLAWLDTVLSTADLGFV